MTQYSQADLDRLIAQIKREAKKLTKAAAEGMTHCRALEQLSREHGYNSYAALLAARKATP